MPEGMLKLRLLVDKDLIDTTAQVRMMRALEKQRAMVLAATDGRLGTEWELIPYSFRIEDIPWTQNSVKGLLLWTPAAHYVQEMTDAYRGDASFLQMMIHQGNWKPSPGNIGGFNMFETQVLKVDPAWGVYSWFVTLEMELAHSFDQIIQNRLGININSRFDVSYYDRDVVHGADPRYNEFDYGHVYKELQNELIEIYPYMAVDKLTWEEIEVLSWSVFGRAADEGMKGYVGKSMIFTLSEWEKSAEGIAKKFLLQAAQAFKPL